MHTGVVERSQRPSARLWAAGGVFAIAAAIAPLLRPGSSSADVVPRSITIMATGEILPHPSDFTELTPLLQAADLAICTLGFSVGEPQNDIAAAGWDRCATPTGHAGEADGVPMVNVDGVEVANLAYTWDFTESEPTTVLADARAAKAAGAAVVVVSLHWGDEFDHAGSPQQRAVVEQLLASSDVDLLLGTGPHVLQPVAQSNGKFALLSLGNLVSDQGVNHPESCDGVVAAVTLTVRADGVVHSAAPVIRPTWYDASAGRVRLLPSALEAPPSDEERQVFEASWARTAAVMGPFVIAIAR